MAEFVHGLTGNQLLHFADEGDIKSLRQLANHAKIEKPPGR